jgi:hypothetical protein
MFDPKQIERTHAVVQKALTAHPGRPFNEQAARRLSFILQTEAERLLGSTALAERQFNVRDDGSEEDATRVAIRPLTPQAAEMIRAVAALEPTLFTIEET